jgi:ABC-2 type transport system permease protein
MFPREAMPTAAQWLGGALPLTYFLRIMRGVLLKGTGFDAIWKDGLALSVFALVLVTLSATRFRKSLD